MMSNSNGHGSHAGSSAAYLSKRLARLYEYHHTRAEALRLAMEVLDGERTASKKRAVGGLLDEAIALDAERRARVKGKRKYTRRKKSASKRGYGSQTLLHKRRVRTAQVLARLSETEPRKIRNAPRIGIPALIRYGYVVSRADGYVRTSKAYTIDKPE
jgi:hypothetical protein